MEWSLTTVGLALIAVAAVSKTPPIESASAKVTRIRRSVSESTAHR